MTILHRYQTTHVRTFGSEHDIPFNYIKKVVSPTNDSILNRTHLNASVPSTHKYTLSIHPSLRQYNHL